MPQSPVGPMRYDHGFITFLGVAMSLVAEETNAGVTAYVVELPSACLACMLQSIVYHPLS